MGQSFRRVLTWVAVGSLGLFVLFVVNQIAQLVALVDRISPVVGTITLWTLIAILSMCFLIPLALVLRLPKALVPPASEAAPGFASYIEDLRRRLQRNPHLNGYPVETRDEIEAALALLGTKADEIAKKTALRVFVSTAVMQNGSLDALAVIVAQSRMVFEIARIYHQRPSLAQLARLYANVAASAFLARQVEDIDLAEYLQPVISATLTSVLGSAVAAGGAGNIVINSMLSGSANAYLTLRVGVVTRMYCGSLVVPSRSVISRSAILQAAKLVPGVAKEGALQVVNALARAGFGSVKGGTEAMVKSVAESVKGASSEIGKGVTQAAASLLGKLRRTDDSEVESAKEGGV